MRSVSSKKIWQKTPRIKIISVSLVGSNAQSCEALIFWFHLLSAGGAHRNWWLKLQHEGSACRQLRDEEFEDLEAAVNQQLWANPTMIAISRTISASMLRRCSAMGRSKIQNFDGLSTASVWLHRQRMLHAVGRHGLAGMYS